MTHASSRRPPFRLGAVLFDFDGTLTVPGILDFSAIRFAVDCPPGEPILEFIDSLPDPKERARRLAILERFEEEASAAARPAAHAEDSVRRARALGLATGIITRNSRPSVERALRNFPSVDHEDFEVVVTRDDPGEPKPAPDGVLLAAERLGVKPHEILVVGDHFLDVWAGRNAGAVTVLLHHQYEGETGVGAELQYGTEAEPPADARGQDLGGGEYIEPDFTIGSLAELERVMRLGLPLRQGKLPSDMLARYLETLPQNDPSVILGPRVGEDVAAVVPGSGDQVITLKSDPITFVTERSADYLVAVNANDIVTSGAKARWLLSTVLLPPGTVASAALSLLDDVAAACRRHGVALCGGHTEITDAVTRPVVIGSMVGSISPDRLLDKRNMQRGDQVLMTKHAGLEGTAVLANELGATLRIRGISNRDLDKARGLVDELSIALEARIAADMPGTSALHDVTEGGIATALRELSAAGGNRVRVDAELIPIHPLTRVICEATGADPLGLIGSGSLLICCRSEAHEELLRRIGEAGIPVARIGEIDGAGVGIVAERSGQPTPWPEFERDEVARVLESG